MKPPKMWAVVNHCQEYIACFWSENAAQLYTNEYHSTKNYKIVPVLVVPDGEVIHGSILRDDDGNIECDANDQMPFLYPADRGYEDRATLIVHRAGEANPQQLTQTLSVNRIGEITATLREQPAPTSEQINAGREMPRNVDSTIVSDPMDGTSPRISAVPHSGLAQRMYDRDVAYGAEQVAQLQREVAALREAVKCLLGPPPTASIDGYRRDAQILDLLHAAFPEGR